MLQLYVSTSCYNFMLQFHVMVLCYSFMLQLHVTTLEARVVTPFQHSWSISTLNWFLHVQNTECCHSPLFLKVFKEQNSLTTSCYFILQLHVTTLCFNFLLQFHVTISCYNFMLQFHVTISCYGFMLQFHVTASCYNSGGKGHHSLSAFLIHLHIKLVPSCTKYRMLP